MTSSPTRTRSCACNQAFERGVHFEDARVDGLPRLVDDELVHHESRAHVGEQLPVTLLDGSQPLELALQ